MSRLKLLCMDVDGTLTDGKIYLGADGEFFKAFDVKDGYAISSILPTVDIRPVIITGRQSILLERRCEELGIEDLYQGVADKTACLECITQKMGVTLSEVAYIGDDLNDFPCMKAVLLAGGMVGCPSDACRDILDIASFVSARPGGRGAVREFIEWLIGHCDE